MSEAVSTKITEVLYVVIPLVLFVITIIVVSKFKQRPKKESE